MTFRELQQQIKTPFFTNYQVRRVFGQESTTLVNVQLARMVRRGDLVRLKRGIYAFPELLYSPSSELVLASLLYQPSYISLETALNMYGIIPDIPQRITSVTPVTSRLVKTMVGDFLYSKIQSSLYFGFTKIKDETSSQNYLLATPEKALLDYIYVRNLNSLRDLRVSFDVLDKQKLANLVLNYPPWVRRTVNE